MATDNASELNAQQEPPLETGYSTKNLPSENAVTGLDHEDDPLNTKKAPTASIVMTGDNVVPYMDTTASEAEDLSHLLKKSPTEGNGHTNGNGKGHKNGNGHDPESLSNLVTLVRNPDAPAPVSRRIHRFANVRRILSVIPFLR